MPQLWWFGQSLLLFCSLLCSLRSITSFCEVGDQHLINSVSQFSNQVATSNVVTVETLTANPVSQRVLKSHSVSFFVGGIFCC